MQQYKHTLPYTIKASILSYTITEVTNLKKDNKKEQANYAT